MEGNTPSEGPTEPDGVSGSESAQGGQSPLENDDKKAEEGKAEVEEAKEESNIVSNNTQGEQFHEENDNEATGKHEESKEGQKTTTEKDAQNAESHVETDDKTEATDKHKESEEEQNATMTKDAQSAESHMETDDKKEATDKHKKATAKHKKAAVKHKEAKKEDKASITKDAQGAESQKENDDQKEATAEHKESKEEHKATMAEDAEGAESHMETEDKEAMTKHKKATAKHKNATVKHEAKEGRKTTMAKDAQGAESHIENDKETEETDKHTESKEERKTTMEEDAQGAEPHTEIVDEKEATAKHDEVEEDKDIMAKDSQGEQPRQTVKVKSDKQNETVAEEKQLPDDSEDIGANADSQSEGSEEDKLGDVVKQYTGKDLKPDEEPEDYSERDPNEFPILVSQSYYSADSIKSVDTSSIRDISSELKFTPSGQILQTASAEGTSRERVPFVDEKMDMKKTATTRFTIIDKKEKAKVKAKHKDIYHSGRRDEGDADKGDDDLKMDQGRAKDSVDRAKGQSEAIAELERSLPPLGPEEQPVPPWVLSDEDIEYPDYYYYFRSKSDVKFDSTSAAELIQEVLNEELQGKVYSPEESGTWTKNIATTLRNGIKGLGFKRYKYVVQVVLGENNGAGIQTASRCLWDVDCDNHASDTYTNDTIFCMTAVFAVYYY